MISVIKDLFSNQVVSAVILTIIGAITKKYISSIKYYFISRHTSFSCAIRLILSKA